VSGTSAPATLSWCWSVSPEFTTENAAAIPSKVTKICEWTTNYVSGPLNGNGVNTSRYRTSIINAYVVESRQPPLTTCR